MKAEGLEGRRKRRFRVTTDSRHSHPIAPNVLSRDFTTPAPNKVWVGDITYIWTREGWLYLAVLLDLFSRRVVGWALDTRLDASVALEALDAALGSRQPEPGLIHHSDRGVQYASRDYRLRLKQAGGISSMSRKGDCWDNAVAESFFATLKAEVVPVDGFVSRRHAMAAIFDYIEAFYNCRRRHSTLDQISPADHEAAAARRSLVA
jgi:transposase InsO family protein